MNKLAIDLNDMIKRENPNVYNALSRLGKELFYPKDILSQSAEANKKAYRFNATIGVATDKGKPMHFDHIQQTLNAYEPKEIYPYAPPSGVLALREEWKKKMLRENPSLLGKRIGLPISTNGLTHGLSIAADLFVDEQDSIVIPNKLWGNYRSIFGLRRGGILKEFDQFNEQNEWNVAALRECLFDQKSKGKAIVLLNFPSNPTGYTPNETEAKNIISVLMEAAELGINLVVILDDAYFGLFYENSIKESLFGQIAGVHPNILTVKIDGATKENYVWGLRVGFITFASSSNDILLALEQKTNGLIRGTVSSGAHLSQTVILKSLRAEKYEQEKQEKLQIMKQRARKVKEIVYQKKYSNTWSVYPFNSGYFMCLKLKKIDAEELRLHLLDAYGVGTVAINTTDLRIAFSCIEEENLEELFDIIYRAIHDLMEKINV